MRSQTPVAISRKEPGRVESLKTGMVGEIAVVVLFNQRSSRMRLALKFLARRASTVRPVRHWMIAARCSDCASRP